MSKVDAHWELMGQIKALRDEISPKTVLFGNGDVLDLKTAKKYISESGIDGVMIGRGIFQNPFLFGEKKIDDLEISERLDLLIKHMEYFEEEFGETKENLKDFGKRLKSFNLMKKFFKIYVNGFDGAKELRIKLMEAKNIQEVKEILEK
jgi:tRNA-dihydrouridine synthase